MKTSWHLQLTRCTRCTWDKVYRNESNSWFAPLPFTPLPFTYLTTEDKQWIALHHSNNVWMESQRCNSNMLPWEKNIWEPCEDKKWEDEKCWHMSTFGVYHPQKPGQLRVVFDSSPQHSGLSLDDKLLKGPDLNNSLLVFGHSPSPAVAIIGLRRAIRVAAQEFKSCSCSCMHQQVICVL